MKTPIVAAGAYLTRQSPVNLAIGVVLVLGVVYYLGRKTIEDTAKLGAGLATGNNVITQNQHNLAGDKTTAYEDKGILGTLGGAANSLSGGIFASVGETLGGWTFDLFGPKYEGK